MHVLPYLGNIIMAEVRTLTLTLPKTLTLRNPNPSKNPNPFNNTNP